jgi:hypothetical protein
MAIYSLREVTLVGGFACKLTDEQANEWQEYIGAQREFQELHRVEVRMSSAVYGGREGDALVQLALREELLARLHEIAHAWVAEHAPQGWGYFTPPTGTGGSEGPLGPLGGGA